MRNGYSVQPPPLSELLKKIGVNLFQSLHCVKIGKIKSFDTVKRTASIELVFRRRLTDGTIQDFPDLYDCPVLTLQGGGAQLTFPIAVDDECVVLFSDNNIDAWYELGIRSLPYDGRRHDISDGIAIVGINSLINPLSPATTASEVSLDYMGAKVAEKNGKITLQNATTNLITVMDTLLTAMNTYQTAMGVFLAAVASSAVLDAPTKTAASTMAAANTAFQTATGVYKTAVDALLY